MEQVRNLLRYCYLPSRGQSLSTAMGKEVATLDRLSLLEASVNAIRTLKEEIEKLQNNLNQFEANEKEEKQKNH